LQHSVDDVQLSLTAKYHLVMPNLPIVQMVDDLLGEVPEKHPNRVFQTREGHQRMIQALKQSDQLIVTTEPLADYYKKYVPDVWRVPNALGKQWLGLNKVPEVRERLRVGWIGAGQHKGDLDLVAEVVRQLAPEVDWVFMGMATDEIKPHLKEFHGYVSIGGYPKYMSELNLDIAIAPLEDNMFNACKSNLRLLEYGAMGWPVVCSDVFPYRADDPPVLRCANTPEAWIAALRQLMADRELRLSMGAQLNGWLHANFLLSGMVTKWKECLVD
jgi:glycosyltransferase involved in cell wall biosynthesis